MLTYGARGTGKSHTVISGNPGEKDPEGLVLRSVKTIFAKAGQLAHDNPQAETKIKMSAIELRLEKLYDLLEPQRTGLRILDAAGSQNAVHLVGNKQKCVDTVDEAAKLLIQAVRNRSFSLSPDHEYLES